MRTLVLIGLSACAGVSSDPSHIETVASGLVAPSWLAQDQDHLYFVDQVTQAYQLLTVPKTGGSADVLATGHVIGALAADDLGVYWLDFDGTATHTWGLPRGAAAPTELAASSGFSSS